MDPELLERLLIDRALQALPPETESLLGAYLAHDRQAAAHARQFEDAADLARRALKDQPESLPEFPAARILRAERTKWWRGIVRNAAGIAAATLLGVALGAALFRNAPVEPTRIETLAAAQSRVERPEAATSPEAPGVWSARRLYERATGVDQTKSTRLIWDSPVRRPTVGGAS